LGAVEGGGLTPPSGNRKGVRGKKWRNKSLEK